MGEHHSQQFLNFRERLALARICIQSSISIFVLMFCGFQLSRPNCDRYELGSDGSWRLKVPAPLQDYYNRGCVNNNEVALYWSGITSVLASWLPSPLESSGGSPEQQQTINTTNAVVRQRKLEPGAKDETEDD